MWLLIVELAGSDRGARNHLQANKPLEFSIEIST
jgi:hypothetical protein